MPDTIVVLTEQALGADDAARITGLHAGEALAYRVLVPADTDQSMLAEVVDHLSLLHLRKALDALRGNDPDPGEARAGAEQALRTSLDALTRVGAAAEGEITTDQPVAALTAAVQHHQAREVIVVTRPHAVEDTFHTDWASRAREALGVPVLHVYAGSSFVG